MQSLEALTRDAQMFFSRWGTSRKPRWMLWGRLLLLTPGFQLVFWLRVQRALKTVPVVGPALRRCLWYVTTIWFSCDVDPEVEIGPGLYLPHPLGIVIGVVVLITIMGLVVGQFSVGSHIQMMGMPISKIIDGMPADKLEGVARSINIGLAGMSMLVQFALGIVLFFYLIGSLFDERKDRSVLF